METGRNWAKEGYWDGSKHVKSPVKEITRKNDPIKGIKIVSLEIRSEGGRAYKVITPDDYYFDVREDVLMDAMIEAGISKGGIMNGSYVWAKVGSAMKLVRVGSLLHDALIAATADRTLKKLKYGELQVGHVYKGKGAKCYLFLGYVDTEKFIQETIERQTYSTPAKYKYVKKEIRNGLLMLDYKEYTYKQLMNGEASPYCIEINTSHSLIKDVGTVSVPADIVNKINIMCSNGYEKSITDAKKYSGFTNQRLIDSFAYYGACIVVRETGSKYVAPAQYSDIIDEYKLG
jgi:hypothetical protein